MSDIELYDPTDLVSPSPTRAEYSRGPPGKVTSAPAWLTVILFAGLAYQVCRSVLEPAFLGLCAALVVVAWYLSVYAHSYPKYTARNALDLDAYLGSQPGFLTCAYLAFTHRLGSHAISREAAEAEGTEDKFEHGLPLVATSSPHLDGLRVTSLGSSGDDVADEASPLPLPTWPKSIGANRLPRLPVIVGTIRMGFGHHRIAYSACSWALESGSPTYFHDLLNIESKEAQIIRDTDKLYSKGSRLASELGGVVEAVWGMITLAGSENSLRQTWQMAEGLIPLMMAMDKNIPVIASHSLVGMVAVACGFKTVVNCLIDNHAQWFVVVPGALNLVQGPGNLFKLRKLGVPQADIRVGGHWCPADLVNNIEDDCSERMRDLQLEASGLNPAGSGAARRTFLLPIGGAGAQRKFVIDLVRAVISSGLLDEGVQLVLNAGDHAHMKVAFEELLNQPGSPQYETLTTLEEVRQAASDRHGLKRRARIILCTFDSYFPAVATTDIMCRAVDVLACKPSELAFYCIPKLMIRRVGDHEQFSAIRAYELGDGTREVREVQEALEWMRIMLEPGSEVMAEMNRRIAVNGSIGVYDGSKNAVEWAKKMAAAAMD